MFLDTLNNSKVDTKIASLITEIEYEVTVEEPLSKEEPEDLLTALEARLKG